MTNFTEQTVLSGLQEQLRQLAQLQPALADPAAPAGQIWRSVLQEIDEFSQRMRLQALTLETIAAISENTDTISEMDELVDMLATLIQDRFNFYYFGLFLLDQTGRQAELRLSKHGQTGLPTHALHLPLDPSTTVGRAIKNRQSIVTRKDDQASPAIPSYHPDLPVASVEIVLPLISRGEVTGALVLQNAEDKGPDPQVLAEVLKPLAAAVAHNIQNTHILAVVDDQLEQMATLYHISLQVGSHLNINLQLNNQHLDFGELLDDLARLSIQLTKSDAAIIRLINADNDPFIVTRATAKLAQALQQTKPALELKADLSYQVAGSRQAVLANDWPHHGLSQKYTADSASSAPIVALMNVPIILRGRIIGTIEVQSFTDPYAFTENDLHILSLLASQAAVAIENTHLFTQAENNSRFLKTVIEHIPDPIFIKDRRHVWIELNQAYANTVGLPDNQLIGKTDYDFLPKALANEFYRRDVEVFETNQKLNFEETVIWADDQPHTVYTRLIPIPDSTGQPEYLLGITHDITERKAREAERERLLTEMATLYNGSQAIASALSERQVFEALFQQIRTQDPAEVLAYYFKLVDGEPIWADLAAQWQKEGGRPKPRHQRIDLAEAPYARILTLNETVFVEDVATSSFLSEAERTYFVTHNIAAMAAIPMAASGQEIGLVLIHFAEPYTFTKTTKRFWRAMVDQAAVLLTNRQLIQEVAYRAVQIETAADIARTASAILDVKTLLNAVVRLIRDRFSLYYVGVFLVDEAREWAVLQAGTGQAGRQQLQEKHRLKIGGESMIGWCLANSRARVALDVGKEAVHFQNPHLPGTHSEIALPLIYRNQVIGALTVQSTEQAAFTKQDTIFLQTMADQLANAIENARLFEKVQQDLAERKQIEEEILQRNRELAAINRVTAAVTSTLELQHILEATAREMASIFRVRSCGIALLNRDKTELTLAVEHTIDESEASPVGLKIPVHGNASSEHVIKTGESLVIAQAQTNPLTTSVHELLRGRHTECIMLVPLKARGEVVGTIGLDINQPDRTFTPAEVELAETIAGQVAGSVENAHLFEQTQQALAEQQRAEEALRQAEEKYRGIFEHTAEGIFQTSPEGRYLSVNPALAKIYRYDSPEDLMTTLTDIERSLYVEPGRRREFTQLIEANGVISEFESQVYRKDGSIIWISENARVVRNRKGKLLYYEGTVIDITERKRAEEALRTSQELLNAIVDNSTAPIYVIDREGRFLIANDQFARVFGFEHKEDIIGKTDYDISPPEVAQAFQSHDLALLGSGVVVQEEEHISQADGIHSYVTAKFPLYDAAGRPYALCGIASDITDRRRVEEALRQNEAFNRAILNSLPAHVIVIDQDGSILAVNEAWKQFADENNGNSVVREGHGLNYLQVCREATGPESEFAQQCLVGLQALLEGETTHFDLQYPCPTPTAKRWYLMRAVPLNRQEGGLVISHIDITDQKSAEIALQEGLARTQTLHRVSNILTGADDDEQTVFEAMLAEYLRLLKLQRGGLMLFDEVSGYNTLRALYIDGQPVRPNLILSLKQDLVAQHLIQTPGPLVIEDVRDHPATKNYQEFLSEVKSMLLLPLILRDKVVGRIGADATEPDYVFSREDIEVGQALADQLVIWLENRQLLRETQKRSHLLQTASEVSKAASSILDVNQLINDSVNLIRDNFDFYYVGLFIIDEAREWAVLRAGTGQAGRIQLDENHRLKIGGGSMIGWSIENQRARIALDVGQEAVHFKRNKYLPETRSEMALPLLSRDKVMGALTVQSVERNAFSDEDITVLQTMADQLANAIQNAHLFEEVMQAQEEAEERLQETIALQQLSQALSGTLHLNDILDIFFRACTKVIGFEYVQFSLVDEAQQRVKATAGIGIPESLIKRSNRSLAGNDIMADIIRNGQTEIITGWDDRFDRETYEAENHADWVRVFTPITLRQQNIGLVEAGFNKTRHATVSETHVRLLRAFIDQTAIALENAKLYEASQRAARREALIKEITTKVRASTEVETILETTVKELAEALNSKRTYIQLKSLANGQTQDQ